MNILYVARLSDSKLKEKLTPLLGSSLVDHIYVLRDFPGINFDSRVTYLSPEKCTINIFRHISKVFKGVKYCRKRKIDVIFGVLNTPHGYIGRTIGFLTRLPYIHLTIAGHREFWLDGKITERVNCLLFRHSAFTMVTGSQTKKYLESKRFDPDRVVVIPNIPDNAFLNITNVPAIEERKYDIIFISRIDKNKNLELLFQALSILKSNYSPKVLVVGDGPDLKRMQDLSYELELDKYIDFEGYISKIEEKIYTYNKAKIFVSCSRGEGFPVSLLEAMCCGCVPVVSNVGDIVDAIAQGVSGYVFNDVDNPEELAHYLLSLFEDHSLLMKMSEASRMINTKVSVDRNTEIWDNVLSQLYREKNETNFFRRYISGR